jgi:hypothetical protein
MKVSVVQSCKRDTIHGTTTSFVTLLASIYILKHCSSVYVIVLHVSGIYVSHHIIMKNKLGGGGGGGTFYKILKIKNFIV